MAERPASVPPGVRVELSRARVKPGMGGEVDRWMRMLNDRLDDAWQPWTGSGWRSR